MRKPTEQELYGLLIAGLFAAVALWRYDLVLEAWRVTNLVLARGGPARWRLLGEIGLFCAILIATWRVIPTEVRPAHDAAVVIIAALFGWAVEAWGTRLGLWRYYTGERPPLWIVPVWSLGAVLVERIAERAAERARRWTVPAACYWAAAAVALGLMASFFSSWPAYPSSWAAMGLLLAALTVGVEPQKDFWILSMGMICVFFADLWGTTNGCWAYYLHRSPWGLWRGISFGMALDAAVVLAALRSARFLEKAVFYRIFSCNPADAGVHSRSRQGTGD